MSKEERYKVPPGTCLDANERRIRLEWEEKERNCTIVGEGYAERQIVKTLELAGKINTEL